MKLIWLSSLLIFFSLQLSCAQDNPPFIESPTEVDYTYKTIVEGIDIPWGMAFISENDLLVTEKSGLLYRVTEGVKQTVEGLPPIYVRGQGGL